MIENKLKTLNTELKRLEDAKKGLLSKKDTLTTEVNSNRSSLSKIANYIREKKKEIHNLSNSGETIISEHAILRYLERECGLEIDNIKSLILNEEAKGLVSLVGSNGNVKINGLTYVIVDNVIVTIK